VSDKPEGPGWWIASDGKWYPPELHPSFKDDARTEPTAPRTTPQQVPVQHAPVQQPPVQTVPGQTAGEPETPRWQGQGQGQGQKAATVGRQFPDLFQKALQGSHLADNVTVKYDGDDERNEAQPSNPSRSGSMRKMTPGGGDPVVAGTAGVTFAAPAKRKWRKGH
jgi:hypothetical protein